MKPREFARFLGGFYASNCEIFSWDFFWSVKEFFLACSEPSQFSLRLGYLIDAVQAYRALCALSLGNAREKWTQQTTDHGCFSVVAKYPHFCCPDKTKSVRLFSLWSEFFTSLPLKKEGSSIGTDRDSGLTRPMLYPPPMDATPLCQPSTK